MDIILKVFNYIQDLGPSVMMPVIMCVFGLALGATFGKSLRAGLTVGVGFIGLNLVIGALTGNLGPAVSQMVDRFGFSLSIIDVGWPAAAAISFASTVGLIIIPVGLIVNIIMLLTNTTQTIDVDIWDYWHFAFTGALVAILTKNVALGVVAAVINMIIIMVLADVTAHDVQESLDMPGISLPHGFSTAYAPIAWVFNKLIELIPGLNKIDFNIEEAQQKFGVFGEPILIGTILGLVIGALAGYVVKDILILGVTMGAVLVLIPKMAALLMEGLLPISDAASEMIKTKFKNRGKIFIGLDSAVGIGHPITLTVALILVPVAVFLAVILPGNKVLPFGDLATIPWMFVLITPMVRGNGFRALVVGVIVLAVGLLIATNLSPLFTQAAIDAKFAMPTGASMVSSIVDGANPLTWAIVRLHGLGIVGTVIAGVFSIALAIWNRARILKEAAELRLQDAKE